LSLASLAFGLREIGVSQIEGSFQCPWLALDYGSEFDGAGPPYFNYASVMATLALFNLDLPPLEK